MTTETGPLQAQANQHMLDQARAIIERDYKPRPGCVSAIAPNGQQFAMVRSRDWATPVEAVQELEKGLRAAVVTGQGDTVWWRRKPELVQDFDTKRWTVSCRLMLGWARDEIPMHTPGGEGCEYPAVYPEDGAATASGQHEGVGAVLPRWKCHKIVEADRVSGFEASEPPKFLMLDCGAEIPIDRSLFNRLPDDRAQWTQGYLVRYADGYLSWSPAKAFEDGYTRETL